MPNEPQPRADDVCDAQRPRVAFYTARADDRAAEADRLSRLALIVARARLVTALAALALGVAWLAGVRSPWLLTGLLGPPLLVWLVVRHTALQRRQRIAEAVVRRSLEQRARASRQWDLLSPATDGHEPTRLEGLGVSGHASLLHLIDTTGTPFGSRRLRDWLLDPATPTLVADRQEAVRELAACEPLREAFGVHAFIGARVCPAEIERFLAWAEQPSWLLARPWVHATVVALTVAVAVALAVEQVSGPLALWPLPIVAGWGLLWAFKSRIEETYGLANALATQLEGLRDLFVIAARTPVEAPLLRAARAGLEQAEGSTSASLAHLRQLVALSDLRHSALPYLAVQSLTLWDLHVWWAFDRWRARHGRDIRRWLESLGTLDALAALGTLAADHPHWSFATVSPDVRTLRAAALGHPLIAPAVCVTNDITVGPAGTVVVVTGSNMSGKSTLLRSLGLNALLAQSGAPVCAVALELPPVRVETSIHVADSLAGGVSYFLAVLQRLRDLLGSTREPHAAPVLYLIDEVLQGTNSRERHLAVRHLLRHLLATDAIGVITTHDLHLTTTPECVAAGRLVHFSEQIVGAEGQTAMRFDYRLREGPATSTNALVLVEQAGLTWPGGLDGPVETYTPMPSRSRS